MRHATASPTLAVEELPPMLADDTDRAFPALVAAMHGPIFGGVFRMVGSYHDAEDVTQETFVRAYRALCRYPAEQIRELRLRPWLWTIAVNLCRNRARDRSRRPITSSLDGVAEPAATGVTADDAVAATTDEWTARLATLPAPMRTAVVLRHVIDLDYDEISETTGRPVGTVKSDVHRGLDRLRQLLAAETAELEGAL